MQYEQKSRQFYKIFKREWNKRFQLVKADGTPLELPKEKQDDDGLSEELSEKELEEMELIEDIGNYLDGIVEKLESEEEGDGGEEIATA